MPRNGRINVNFEVMKSVESDGGYITCVDEGCTVEELARQEHASINKSDVTVNGQRVEKDYVLEEGDRVVILTRNYNSGYAA